MILRIAFAAATLAALTLPASGQTRDSTNVVIEYDANGAVASTTVSRTASERAANIGLTGCERVPRGIEPVTDTIDIGNEQGGTLEGYGYGPPLEHASALDRSQSVQAWMVDLTDRPMYRFRGTNYIERCFSSWADCYNENHAFTPWTNSESFSEYEVSKLPVASTISGTVYPIGTWIYARDTHTAKGSGDFDLTEFNAHWALDSSYDRYDLYGGMPTCQALIQYDAGLGTGDFDLEHRAYFGFDLVHQFGTLSTDDNCDKSKFDRCEYLNCGTIAKSMHAQVIDVVHEDTSTNSTPRWLAAQANNPRFWHVVGGGGFTIRGGNTLGARTMFYIDNQHGGVGPNNGWYRIDGHQVDMGAGNRFVLWEQNGTNNAVARCTAQDVHLQGVTPYAVNDRHIATIYAGTYLRIEGGEYATGLKNAILIHSSATSTNSAVSITGTKFGNAAYSTHNMTDLEEIFDTDSVGSTKLYAHGNLDQTNAAYPEETWTVIND